jgi:hypothetical protein
VFNLTVHYRRNLLHALESCCTLLKGSRAV